MVTGGIKSGRGLAAAALVALAAWCGTARADPAADARAAKAAGFLTALFTGVCLPNQADPRAVWRWAESRHLPRVTAALPLGLFVGDGPGGAAWGIPRSDGSFALSIRGTTGACAVWAREADAGIVLDAFKGIIDARRHPGVNVTVRKDDQWQTPWGRAHELVFSVAAARAATGMVYTLLTAEHSGGAFQASMQVARAKMPKVP